MRPHAGKWLRFAVTGRAIKITGPMKGRFWSKVNKLGLDECWEWNGYRNKKGYGRFYIKKGIFWVAHRFAFLLEFGDIPDGLFVLHGCDNPPCCNPAHLRSGTLSENLNDAYIRGRRIKPKGGLHPQAVLTAEEVKTARNLYEQGGVTVADLSRKFSISNGGMWNIVHYKNWKHIL